MRIMVTLTQKQLQQRLNAARQAGMQSGRNPKPSRRRARQAAAIRAPNPIPKGLDPGHHFDAFSTGPPQALAFSIGPATAVGGLRSFSPQLATTDISMFAFQPKGGVNQGQFYTSADNGVTWSTTNVNIGTTGFNDASGASASSPETIMCSRGSIRVRNVSRAADAGGVVRALRVSTGLDMASNTDKQNTYYLVKGHYRTHTYSGSALTAAHQWDCIPVSQDKYHGFIPPNSNANVGLLDPGVSTILLVFEQFSTSQNYEITLAGKYYARYGHAGPLANSAIRPPTTTVARTNLLRDAAEAIGSAGKKVGGALLNQAAEALPGYIGNLVRQNMNGGRLARVGAMAIEGAEPVLPMLMM